MAHCNTLSNTEQQKWKMFSWAQTGPVRCTHRKIISLKATNGYSYNNVECGCAPGTIWHIKLHCGTLQSCAKTQYFSINWFLCNSTLIMSQAFNYTSACYKNETMINNSGSERRVPPWSAVRCMKSGEHKKGYNWIFRNDSFMTRPLDVEWSRADKYTPRVSRFCDAEHRADPGLVIHRICELLWTLLDNHFASRFYAW